MKSFDHRLLRMKSELAFRRIGCFNGMAVGSMILALASWTWLVPHEKQQVETGVRRLDEAKQGAQAALAAPPPPPRAIDQERLAAFHDLLGEQGYAEQQVKTLFAAAAKSGLSLNQAEYKSGFDQNGGFATYQVVLPVKGSYAAIRDFCERVLLSVPFAALDDVGFKRETIGNVSLEARLRFTIYLEPGAPKSLNAPLPPEEGARI
jgi:hypothetical protein